MAELTKAKCWFCRPVVVATNGADHTGLDAFMRCPKCRWRTTNHVECHSISPPIVRMLREEWKYGRREPSAGREALSQLRKT